MRWCLALAAVAAVLVAVGACGTEPVGVEDCKKIERVRCESAQACGLDLTRPVHSGDSAESNVAACIRYYDDQCLHGLAVAPPKAGQTDACVDAIIKGDCDIVKRPELHPACSFLAPPAATSPTDAAVEASSEAAASTDAADQ